MEGCVCFELAAAHRSLPDAADEHEAGERRDCQETGSHVQGKGTDRTTAHIRSVRMFTMTVGKGNGTGRHKKQDDAQGKGEMPPGGQIGGLHEEPGVSV